MKITDRNFFDVPSYELAEKLLGKILCRKTNSGIIRRRITETEAYGGFETADSASHASRGKTARNAPMFECGGTVYVYLCYGIHEMLNITSGKTNDPQAVLIRGVENSSGPGRVSKTMQIDRNLSGKDIITSSELWVEDDGCTVDPALVKRLPRIGIEYANDIDKARLARFVFDTCPAKC